MGIQAGARRRQPGKRLGTGIRTLAFGAALLVLAALITAAVQQSKSPGSSLASLSFMLYFAGILALILLGLCVLWYEQAVRRHSTTLQESTQAAAKQGLSHGLNTGERRLAALTAGSTDVALVLDEKLCISYASASSQRVLGRSPVSLRTLPIKALLETESRDRCERALPAMADGTQLQLQLVVLHADGHHIPVEATITSHLKEQFIAGYVVNLRDLSDISHFTAELAHQALHDPLTDLPNRRMFAGLVAQTAREEDPRAQVLVLDIDDFAQVNSSFGHAVGDQVLLSTASRLRAAVGNHGAVARLGGDDFGILLRSGSRIQAAGVLQAVSLPVLVAGIEVPVKVRMGVADFHSSAEDMLRNAEIAMHCVKSPDGTRIEHYEPGLQERAAEEFALKQDLAKAIRDGGLSIVYQPIIDLRTTQIHGVEALVRWEHPERGFISPDEFVPLAEQSGMIVHLGRWVLMEACRAAVRMQAYQPDLMMSVNLSALQLSQPHFVQELLHTLDKSGLDPDRLMLEITESAVVVGMERVVPLLDALRCLGIHVSVDDFGTGYSSLHYLSRLPLDELKVDKSFVDRLPWDQQMQSVVRGMLSMSAGLGLITVAEGIESSEQADWLRQTGCVLGQGYLFGKPQTEANMSGWLAGQLPGANNVIPLPRIAAS